MICAVYKSPKKDEMYLYLPKRDDFSSVPEGLLAVFGKPIFVTLMKLGAERKLAREDVTKVRDNLALQGFHLQMPPPQEDLLAEHKAYLNLTGTAPKEEAE